jgi:hypothetical protein
MKRLVLIIFLLLIPIACADTTFFDNLDDVFIMNGSATSGVIGRTTGQVTGGGICRYEWNCTNWSECLPSGKQTRNCTNVGTCFDRYRTPEIERNCIYIPSSKDKKEDKNLEINRNEIVDKENIFIYLFIIVAIGLVILYLKRKYIKRLIKKFLKY